MENYVRISNEDIFCEQCIFIRKRRKFNCFYAGLIMLFVPSVFCETDWPKHLTYDNIYNNTYYAQIQKNSRPYNLPSVTSNRYYTNNQIAIDEYSDDNDIEYEEDKNYRDDVRVKDEGKTLIGFSHDPYRFSVTEDDYEKGVRYMSPEVMKNRGKRGVVHLYNMIYCATGCEPLSYKGYGCYCGFLGSGRPTDGIDRCCKMHDQCYENIYCPLFTVYFQPYYWKCYQNQPLCALENFHSQHRYVNGCAGRLCECDRRFAMCIKNYKCPRRRAVCRSSPIRLLQNLLMFK